MKAAILVINSRLLVDALKLPESTEITDVRMTFDKPGVVQLRIISPLLPETREDEVLRNVDAIYSARRGFERFE